MNEPWKGGKGKTPPYGRTTHARIPEGIKQLVDTLSTQYKRAVTNGREAESLLVDCMECIRQWVKSDEKLLTGKPENTQALEVDQLKSEIDILKQTLANKQQEIELFKTMTQDRKAIARDLVGEYLNGKEMPKTRNWVEMNKFKHWLSDT